MSEGLVKRMKVLFLSYDFGEYSIRLASALAQKAEVCLILPHELAEPYLPMLDQAVGFRPFHKPRLRQPMQQMRVIHTILRQIRDFDPDVIHLQQGHFWFNLALPLLKRYPLTLTIHDPRHHVGDKGAHNTPQTILDFGFRRAAQVIVHGKSLKQVAVDELKIPGENIHVMPMVTHGDVTKRRPTQAQGNFVLFFGRIWGYKGLEYLIRAEPLITAQVPDAKIVIAGEGEDFARYRRLMVNPEHFIIHNEYVSDEKRAKLFQQASVVALPYIEASQSAVIPVAYTFGKPVVATTVGGLPDMVEHNRTGYLIPPCNEQALAEAVVRLLQDKALNRQFGLNGLQKVNTEFSPAIVAQHTLAVYHRTITPAHSLLAVGERSRL